MSVPGLHQEAVLARVRTPADLADMVFDGDAEDTTSAVRSAPYVVVYSDTGLWSAERLDNAQQQVETEHEIQCVGVTPSNALAIAGEVFGAVLNFRPVIEGRSCWPIRHNGSNQVDQDKTTGEWYTTDRFVLRSTPK